MSRFKSHAVKRVAEHKKFEGSAVKNFMNGTSYTLNPLDTLKIVSASGIFGEASYYRKGIDTKSGLKSITPLYREPKESTADVFTKAIDESLKFDFEGTLRLAQELRWEYFMRLNPAVIFIRAALNENRVEFNKKYPNIMRAIGRAIIMRPDDITNQFEYYMYLKGSKNHLPNIVKRVWADRLGKFDRYQISKYQNKNLRDLIRISHASSSHIDELMKLQSGVIQLEDENTTWERLRSEKKSWKEIYNTIKIPHMALLRNLRGIFQETEDIEFAKEVISSLKAGVKHGKQFPFRYYTALQALNKAGIYHAGLLKDALEECIDIAMENFPKLEGKTICLSDNSGSAHGGFLTEYGSTNVAEIDNLSSVMTAVNSDEGYVGIFGDKLDIQPVSKRNGILSQTEKMHKIGRGIGGGTENGIWIFFRDALKNKVHYDNIFIYSDMQAGHGGLYGINPSEYNLYRHRGSSNHIDVLKLVQEYRTKVNPKVNVFSVQTAGYDNSVLPEGLYRGAILTGWTGKEALYAKRIIDIWNGVENRKQ